jgi:hypothetical protein
MGGYPGHPGMMAKRPPGGMGMIGGPQHPGGPQTALVSGQGQQQPGGQGQPDNNVGPGAMVGVPGGPGGPGVMPPNVGVPRSDLALSQFKEVWENLGMYRNFLFQLVPINPSALLEANVKYILATPEGAAIRTPLSLSVYVVMALGTSTHPPPPLQLWLSFAHRRLFALSLRSFFLFSLCPNVQVRFCEQISG